jgi:uncharacterized membrane protein
MSYSSTYLISKNSDSTIVLVFGIIIFILIALGFLWAIYDYFNTKDQKEKEEDKKLMMQTGLILLIPVVVIIIYIIYKLV